MASQLVSATVNGDSIQFACPTDESLLNVLRDNLGLTGAKEGCGTGDCGACSVTMDGRLVCSCLVLGVEAEGRDITTIEGMSSGEQLHPLQQQFIDHAALQCGICTPGFLVAGKALLDRNSDPTEEEIRYALAGNLINTIRTRHACADDFEILLYVTLIMFHVSASLLLFL